jgi:hypothetical protein
MVFVRNDFEDFNNRHHTSTVTTATTTTTRDCVCSHKYTLFALDIITSEQILLYD